MKPALFWGRCFLRLMAAYLAMGLFYDVARAAEVALPGTKALIFGALMLLAAL